MQETKRWRQTGVSGNGSNIGFTRRGILGSSYPVEDSRHQVDSACTDHIVTNIDAFLDFLLIQSVVKNPNEEASRVRVVGRGCVRISIPSNKGEFQCEIKMFCVCRTILQTSYQSQDAQSGDIASLASIE